MRVADNLVLFFLLGPKSLSRPVPKRIPKDTQLSFTSLFRQTANAMAINARLVQAREKPSAVVPIIVKVNTLSITARTNAILDKMINALIAFDMSYLLTLVGSGINACQCITILGQDEYHLTESEIFCQEKGGHILRGFSI